MRPDPATRRGRLVLELGAAILRGWIAALARLCRYRVVAGQEHLDALLAAPRPVVFCLWHDRSVLAAPWVLTRIHRQGLAVTVLASHSRDGELVARLARRLDLPCVRGSSSRGGREAVRALYKAMRSLGASPVVIPDGPRGPKGVFKVGGAVLAQLAGAPIVPLGFAPERAFQLRSWDRLLVPWPFSRISVAVGAPEELPRTMTSEVLESERARLEAVLNAVSARAAGA